FYPLDGNDEDSMASTGDLVHLGGSSGARLGPSLHHLHDLLGIVDRPLGQTINEDAFSPVFSDHERLFFIRKEVRDDVVVDLHVADLNRLDALDQTRTTAMFLSPICLKMS